MNVVKNLLFLIVFCLTDRPDFITLERALAEFEIGVMYKYILLPFDEFRENISNISKLHLISIFSSCQQDKTNIDYDSSLHM